MIRTIRPSIIILLIITSCGFADVFTNRLTGETFDGYALQKVINGKGRVYVEKNGVFKARTIVLSEYKIKYDIKGRRNNIIVVPFDQKEALISKAISKTVARTITNAADKGPVYIILTIDNPGGRGDYMNIICKAIRDTRDCPVIAYITGEKFGGAYGAAAAVALACDKIYIAPSASIGSMAPAYAIASEPTRDQSNLLSPMNLVTYSGYAAKLAENNKRPQILASALMDRSIEVLEVAVDQNDRREFINSTDKVPSQSLKKKWTRLISGTEAIKETLLNITGKDAIYCKMADKLAISQADVIADLGASDAKVIKSATVNSVRRRFLASKRNIDKLMASIEYREGINAQLETQLANLVNRNNRVDIRLQNQRKNTTYNQRNNRRYYNSTRAKRNRNEYESNMITSFDIDQTEVERYRLTMDLSEVLNGLISDYQRVIKLARRFPGAMPIGVTGQMIESKLTNARTRLATM
jgi:hypothetical protein